MLVISRRKGQRVTIGDDIEIVVTAVHKNGVKLGISAPRGFIVLRGEVRDAIFSANLEAVQSTVADAVAVVAETSNVKRPPVPAAKLALRRQPDDTASSQSGDARPTARGSARPEPPPSARPEPPPSARPEPRPSARPETQRSEPTKELP
jgi:carbon storage regulator